MFPIRPQSAALNQFGRKALAAAVVMMALFFIVPCHATLPTGWSGVDISGAATGSESYTSGTFTIIGAGTGCITGSDQMHFTYTNVTGDFKLTARLASFNGVKGSQVGLSLRASASGSCAAAEIAFEPAMNSGPNTNDFYMYNRLLGTGSYFMLPSAVGPSAMTVPCWLQLVRSGNEFGVYKSSNGQEWRQVQGLSGGPFVVSGTVTVGLFVASGTTTTATASFDNVTLINSPVTNYETSWLGNTYTKNSTTWVSGYARGMYTSPNGACYVVSSSDEGGESGKIYQSGTIVTPFGITPRGGGEGKITSDGTHLYFMANIGGTANQIYQTDMLASTMGYNAIFFNSSPAQSGIAYGNGELYVSDHALNEIRVATPTQSDYNLRYNSEQVLTSNSIDVSGVTNPAPQSVYQSQWIGDGPCCWVPLTSGTYTVRMHFAELDSGTNVTAGYRRMKVIVGNQYVDNYDIVATTGTNFKAAVVTFSNVVVTTGTLVTVTTRGSNPGTNTTAVLNGVEILDAAGVNQVKAINCGGPASGSWLTSINELPGRAFPFTRPGPMVVDKRGNLWIIQDGAPFPAASHFVTTGSGSVQCYTKNGQPVLSGSGTPVIISDFVNPVDLCYDSVGDHLYVADNGPAQNVRMYTGLVSGTTPRVPTCTNTFGQSVLSGASPGLAYDPNAGGDARFYGLTGIGLDSGTNLYVCCNWSSNSTNLKAFTPGMNLLWKVQGLEFCNGGDFDASANASDVWTPNYHYTMNYNGSTPGGEWTLKSFLWNSFTYGPQPYQQNNSAIYRKINGVPFLFAAAQGQMGPVFIYRFNGEQIVPCGSLQSVNNYVTTGTTQTKVTGWEIWTDANGDGHVDTGSYTYTGTYNAQTAIYGPAWFNGGPNMGSNANEVVLQTTAASGANGSFDVSAAGDIYITTGNYVEKFAYQGLNSYGVPLYTTSGYSSIRVPNDGTFNFYNSWPYARLRYAGGATDTMYLLGGSHPLAGGTTGGGTLYNYGGTLICYDNWSTSPTRRFMTVLPDVDNDVNLSGIVPTPYVQFVYMSFDVANGIAFPTEVTGPIHMVDSAGNLLPALLAGPEVDANSAINDDCMGTHAHFNPATGEYTVTQEASGWREKENLWRWNPSPVILIQPVNQSTMAGQPASFTVSASGTSALGYQWQMLASGSSTWISLSNGNGYSGATSPTMVLNSLAQMSGNEFRCVVANQYGSVTSGSATLTVQTAYAAWQASVFGVNATNPAIAGDLVANNPAGITNFLAYALGMNPYSATVGHLPKVGLATTSGTNYLSVQFPRNGGDSTLVYCVQVSNNLATNEWTPLSTFNGIAWSGSGSVIESGTTPNINVQVIDSQPFNTVLKRFLRLQISD
jgi:hypothetical protein